MAAAGAQATPTTINAIFQETVAKHGPKTALKYKAGSKEPYKDISYAELAGQVEQLASGLAALGIQKGDRVALLSENRPEWAVTDLAALALGAVIVPLYPTLPAPQVAYIVKNSGANTLVVSDSKQLKKALAARKELPELRHLIVMDADAAPDDASVLTFNSVLERGVATPLGADRYAETWKAVRPDDVASIVYTSGTTGDPKGAQLTHGNFTFDIDAALSHFRRAGQDVTVDDTFLSFLPVCHVFERTTGYYLPLRAGATIGYAEGVFQLVGNMAEVKPTLMVNVPRVYEAMQDKILEQVSKAPPKKQAIFNKALAAGRAYAEKKRTGNGLIGPILAIQHALFERLVFSKMRERFGGRLRFFVSGGAALGAETARFFEAIGLPVMEGYGMTEASPVIAVNPNRRPKIGTVGIALPGVEVKIAADGEILARGPNIMKGYWNNDQATAEMVDGEGWLHTGDVGILDEEGYLKITDRKKDILVLANGKNVAPQPIEAALKGSPFLSEIVLIGDKQNVVTALVLPAKEKLREWARAEGLTYPDDESLLASSEVRKKIKSEIDAHSGHLADFEKIKKFTVLNATFSVDGGEMTPTLKVKRKVVAQKYASEIAAMAGGGGEAAAA